jgi:ribosomal protein S18 acetylase RimI-like enzyme
MITTTNLMTQRQLNKLKLLIAQCKRVDGSAPNIYTHLLAQKRALPASLLYYNKQQQLVAFLSAFFFYDDACEVALMVSPTARGRGIAKKLITAVLPLVTSQNLTTMIFSSPGKRNDNWLLPRGFKFTHTEYHMQRKCLNTVLMDAYPSMIFKEAEEDMIPSFCALDQVCFPKEHNDNPTHFHSLLLNKEEYQLFAAYIDGRMVGKAHLRWTAKAVTFSDIAILPEMQGQGLGSALLAYCLNFAIKQGKTRLLLDVEATNERALKLYTNFGFVIDNTCDYWSIPWRELNL